MPFCRFALRDYKGDARRFFLVERNEIPGADTELSPEVTHHVLVFDRSGSMYRDITAMRAMVEKILTLEEYRDSSMLATLVSYSSEGDFTVHFSRKTVAQIMAPGSAEVEAIRQLRATGLTCISQALRASLDFIEDDETTCINLHSDGYANDRSPTAERREIDALCDQISALPNVFVNTIAYSAYSDFKLLVGIANALSGKCVQAGTVAEVYDALHDTSALLAGRMVPALPVSLNDADYQVFVSTGAGRINGSANDMILRGLKPEHDKVQYRYFEVEERAFLDSFAPVCAPPGQGAPLEPLYAFCAAQLSEGHLNTSKFALMATRMSDLVQVHYRALTATALAAMYADLQTALFRPSVDFGPPMQAYGLGLDKVPLLDLLTYLGENARSLTVDLDHLKANYTRRGLKRVPGRRDEEGNLIEPSVTSRIVSPRGQAEVSSFDLNNANATVNMLCVRDIELHRDGQLVDTVAGIRLRGRNQLRSYNNYTIVGDGELNVPLLRLQINDKRVWRQLQKLGVLADAEGAAYAPGAFYDVILQDLPLVDFDAAGQFASEDETLEPGHALDFTFDVLSKGKVLISLFSGLLKGRSDRFTTEQLEALGEYHITGSLYFSPPTTRPYVDKQAAFDNGQIDTRVSYQIDLGTTDILHRGQLHSANRCLQRFFTATKNGKKVDKPTIDLWWDADVVWGYKTLSSRTKITPIDELMRPIFESFLGLTDDAFLTLAMQRVGVDPSDIDVIQQVTREHTGIDTDDLVEVFSSAKRDANRTCEEVLAAYLRPLVFYIGATGLLPDELDTPALTADAMKARFPQLKIGKRESDGSFFVIDDRAVISVYANAVPFTVDA